MQQWREQYEAQVGDAAVLTPAPAPVQAHSAPASAQEPPAPAQKQPALTPAPAPAQERAAAAPPPQEQSAPRRHRHRIRRRANGAPRSCVLESGRWINLPRARRAAVDTMPAVQKSPHTVTVAAVQEAVRQCRFHLTGGCTRSQCTFGPPGHAPVLDGADRLDPLVMAGLGRLRAQLHSQQHRQMDRDALIVEAIKQLRLDVLAAEEERIVLHQAAVERQSESEQQGQPASEKDPLMEAELDGLHAQLQQQHQQQQQHQLQQQQQQQQCNQMQARLDQFELRRKHDQGRQEHDQLQTKQMEFSLWKCLDRWERVQQQQQKSQQQRELNTVDTLSGGTNWLEQIKCISDRFSGKLDALEHRLEQRVRYIDFRAFSSLLFEVDIRRVINDVNRLTGWAKDVSGGHPQLEFIERRETSFGAVELSW